MAGQGYEDKSQDVKNFIDANINHLLENEELMSFVALYFGYITKTENLFKMNKLTDEFLTQFVSICKEQYMLLVKIRELGVVIKKKQNRTKIGRRVAVGVAGTLFLPVIALAAISSPTFVQGVAGMQMEKGMKSSWEVGGMLKKSDNAKGAQIELCLLIENSINENIGEMEKII